MVRDQEGAVITCRLRGKLRLSGEDDTPTTNPVAVGDSVLYDENEDGTGSIYEISERKNAILRSATHGKRGVQILAANVDLGFSVQSVRQPAFKTGFIDRFLVSCEAYQVTPVILINKMDLASKKDHNYVLEMQRMYEDLGYPLIFGSIFDSEWIDELKSICKDKTSVFIGPSGVGKSSLLNAMEPGITQKTAAISGFSNKGKHTTTYAELFPLHFGGYLVDTPGIREFGLAGIASQELSHYFPEMFHLSGNCRFHNCTHHHEPGCAILAAVDEGQIYESRYKSYLLMLESL